MQNDKDASVELLAELVQERLRDLRRELQAKVETAIKVAAENFSHELAGEFRASDAAEGNGHAASEKLITVR